MRRVIQAVALVGVLSLMQGGSCKSTDSSDDSRYPDTRYPDSRYPDSRDRIRGVPGSADVVQSGTDKVKWTADDDGVVFVVDRENRVLRWSGEVRRRDEILVNAYDDKILINGRPVYDQNLVHDNTHEIRFVSARDRRPRDRY